MSEATAAGDASDVQTKLRNTAAVSASSDNTLPWAATFDARGCEDADFAERTIASIQRCFNQGAIGVKVWKNVGLGIRTKSGGCLLPDHPALMLIYEAIHKAGKTLLVHVAGTSGGWMPIDSKNPEYRYYQQHPEWNLYGRPGAPCV